MVERPTAALGVGGSIPARNKYLYGLQIFVSGSSCFSLWLCGISFYLAENILFILFTIALWHKQLTWLWHSCHLSLPRVLSLESFCKEVFTSPCFLHSFLFSDSPGEYLDLMDDSLVILWFLSLSRGAADLLHSGRRNLHCKRTSFVHLTFVVAGRIF